MYKASKQDAGFSLIELLTLVSLISLSLTWAIPQLKSFIYKAELRQALVDFEYYFLQARTQALSRQEMITISRQAQTSQLWCLGMSLNPEGCDCWQFVPASQACYLPYANTLQSLRLTSDTYPHVTWKNYSNGNQYINPYRGNISNRSFWLEIQHPHTRVKVIVSRTGRIRSCVDLGYLSGIDAC
ncbi:Tfp pilus assembly protein FimT [Allopseudospirillum japonicum]|uniref:Tfp pilus assembly protein FimT n=1 Tax=Allopseudospirillum japonicum TaxID=64971 RepID=A0A1H6SFW5_9GAMM|nr:hypothetical protein [Allopseudospirillum japonicum]SEI66823.1 Tfp pilus assembly protein FimT [Allopseudospirillum japonicum]